MVEAPDGPDRGLSCALCALSLSFLPLSDLIGIPKIEAPRVPYAWRGKGVLGTFHATENRSARATEALPKVFGGLIATGHRASPCHGLRFSARGVRCTARGTRAASRIVVDAAVRNGEDRLNAHRALARARDRATSTRALPRGTSQQRGRGSAFCVEISRLARDRGAPTAGGVSTWQDPAQTGSRGHPVAAD